jgi:hypothetical protein
VNDPDPDPVFWPLLASLLLVVPAYAAEPQRPLPSGSPAAIVPAGTRVHVIASEDLDPDRLRSFARPGVTLWLLTRSNLLKSSTLENLNRFDNAFVQLRAPLKDDRILEKAPRAGVWVDGAALDLVGRVRGPRALAIDFSGALDDALAARLTALKPDVVDWKASGSPDLLSWGLFRALPGRKLVSPDQVVPCDARVELEPAAHVNVASLLTLGTNAFPCGPSPRVRIASNTDLWIIQSIVVRDPTLELELEAKDDAEAKKVAHLLDQMGISGRR